MKTAPIIGLAAGVTMLGLSMAQAQDAGLRDVTPRDPLTATEMSVVEMFEATRESVVFISTLEAAGALENGPFGDMPTGAGSGFFWDDQGHVITNQHVVAGSPRLTVELYDGRVFDAVVVGGNDLHDIAVLRIDIDDSPAPLPLGTSADLRVGQSAYVIGSPFGLDWSLSAGIVSALDRRLPAARGGLIQTDAAINSGNSGGPLLDSAGRLIGVNTAIISPSGVNAGVGFAVPADVVNRVVTQLISNGDYAAPIIGVGIDDRINEALQQDGLSGVVILSIIPGTPAEGAGLLPAKTDPNGNVTVQDVIVALDGEEIRSVDDLLNAVDSRAVGEEIILMIERDGDQREVTISLGRRPS